MIELYIKLGGCKILTTKGRIYLIVVKKTHTYEENEILKMTTDYIKEQLRISRSTASSYLNELVHERYLIKITSRPVMFSYARNTKYQDYYSIREFLNEIRSEN